MRKNGTVFAILFSLLLAAVPSPGYSEPLHSLSAPTRIDLNNPDILLDELWDVVRSALFIYSLDAVTRHPKEEVIRKVISASAIVSSKARFALDLIDVGKKGWTRYYPFSIGDTQFVVRIFLTAERAYQAEAKVLFEGSLENPPVTFQILPDLNSILRDCVIKPHVIHPSSEAARSI